MNVHKISECAQCDCAWNVRVCPMWICMPNAWKCAPNAWKWKYAPNTQKCAPNGWKCVLQKCENVHPMDEIVCPIWMFKCVQCKCVPNAWKCVPKAWKCVPQKCKKCVPNVNVQEMSECGQYKCAQTIRVHPMWMCAKYQSVPNVSVHEMLECAQCECTWNVRVAQCEHKTQSTPNVNVHQMWVGEKSLYTTKCASVLVIFLWVFVPIISLNEMFRCTECDCAPDMSRHQVSTYLHLMCMVLSPPHPHYLPFLETWYPPPSPHTILTTFYCPILTF